jgi:hypothetical protein
MFSALQLLGLALVIAGATMLAGVPGALIGAGIAVGYVGLAGEA